MRRFLTWQPICAARKRKLQKRGILCRWMEIDGIWFRCRPNPAIDWRAGVSL